MGWGGYPPKKISIHASAKEATLFSGLLSLKSEFQSTPPRRRRLMLTKKVKYGIYFNPRLREGGDYSIQIPVKPFAYFNPRLREGGDSIS